MLNLEPGDRIELFYKHSPARTIRGTVRRLLSDREEAMGGFGTLRGRHTVFFLREEKSSMRSDRCNHVQLDRSTHMRAELC